MSETSSETSSHWKLLSFLLVGILIPLTAAALPWLLDRMSPESGITFSVSGPIEGDDALAYSVTIRNEGRDPQHNIEAWLPTQFLAPIRVPTEVDHPENVAPVSPIIKSTLPYVRLDHGDRTTTVHYDLLRSGESVSITYFLIGAHSLVSSLDLERMRVVSNTTVAKLVAFDEDDYLIYVLGTWTLVALLLILFVYSLFFEYVMSPAKKRAYFLQQLEKLTQDGPNG